MKIGKQSSSTVLGYNCCFMEVKFFLASLVPDNLLSLRFWLEETLGSFCLWGQILAFQTELSENP